MKPVKRRNYVIAVEIDVIKRRGETKPSGHIAIVDTNHVSRGFQADAASAERTFDQCDLELNGCSGLDMAGRQEVNAAGADIFCHQGDRSWF